MLRFALVLVPFSLLACAPGAAPTSTATSAPSTHAQHVRLARANATATLGDALPETSTTRLAFSLRRQDEAGLAQLLHDQQDPRSPNYHRWLTPQEYGDRFGVPAATYARIVSWLTAEGLGVTQYPNRLFVEANGTVAQVRQLLGVQLRIATQNGRAFHGYKEALTFPADIEPLILKVGGLDTRVHFHHRMDVDWYGQTIQVLNAADLRVQYDIPTTDTGAAGLTLVVLGTQEGTQANQNANPVAPFIPPDASAIQKYLTTLSNATATYNPIVLPNSGDDFDYAGSNSEYQLDVEMQSVGAPNAKNLDLVLSPASVVFQTGAQYIVNTLSNAVVVSTSLGDCESEEVGYDGGAIANTTSDAYLMRQAVQQGLAEGQTWFAASGDTGADDCNDSSSGTDNGFGGGNATVDFPCSLPEIVCMGGTELSGAGNWSASGALTASTGEVVCNEGADGVGAGGGQSLLYAKPSWQVGVGPESTDGQRDVPDLALIAASNTPGVVDYDCGEGQDSCPDAGTGYPDLDITGGTSVASPLGAGIFAHLAGQVGCRQGDVHATLYALGAAQQAGGAAPFHDITSGNNDWKDPKHKTITGFTAGTGYDLASGWGSVDVATLIASWPPCSTADAGFPPLDASLPDTGGPIDAGLTSADSSAATHEGGAADGGATLVVDSGAVSTADGGARDAALFTTDGAAGDGGSSGGCGCTAAGAAPSRGWVAGLLLLGLVALRRRPRIAA